MPELSIRTELGMPDRLTRFLIEGVVQAALIYTPQLRPGLLVEHALDDELVMVASYPEATADCADDYVFVDWGAEFTHAHAVALPHMTNSGLTMSLGALTADYIMYRRAKAYLPARAVKRRLDAGSLHIVANAPRFPYPAWIVWREDLDDDIAAIAQRTLAEVSQGAENEQHSFTELLSSMTLRETGSMDGITNVQYSLHA